MKPNQDIRNAVEENGFKLWELAEALGIYDGNLSRKLRRELPTDQKEHIFRVIDRMVERRQIQSGVFPATVCRRYQPGVSSGL